MFKLNAYFQMYKLLNHPLPAFKEAELKLVQQVNKQEWNIIDIFL